MKVLELPLPFITPPGVTLPTVDAFGWPHGVEYEGFLKARAISLATRSTFRGLKFKRRYEALSLNELKPLFSFAFNPYVIDIRDQYPVYEREKYNAAVLNGKRMRRSDVMTIDIVLTLVLPPDNRLHYHGISIKDTGFVIDEAAQRRLERESSKLAERGWTWELLRGGQFTKMAFSNHFVMYRCVKDTDIFALYDQADWFSKTLLKSSTRGTMGNVLARVSRRLGIPEDMAHRLFAVGASFGFLSIDHSKQLRVDGPLHLLR